MTSLSKREARKLVLNAAEVGANVLRGVLTIGPEGATVDGQDVVEWLARHADRELVMIAGTVGDDRLRREEVKTCYTCGREYTAPSCPRCASARARLRG